MSDRKKVTGSRPPPQKRPGTSALSIAFVMGLVVVGAFVASGSLTPVDPNGPGGPPTLAPYYNPADYPEQHIVTPAGGFSKNENNLQLQTFGVDNCGQNSVMLFLIDTSGSMSYDDKIGHEKAALTYFTNNMGGLSAIGIDTFGGTAGGVITQIPISYYKDVKPQIDKVINSLSPNGATPTRDAMTLAYNQLYQSIQSEAYPNYQYNLVLITDGVPEQLPPRMCEEQTYDPRDAPLPRCFAVEQDPTIPTDISSQIRDMGVDIYAINVYSPSWPSDAYMYPYLSVLLEKIASQPTSTHYYVSIDGNNLSNVLENIDQSICQDEINNPNTGN